MARECLSAKQVQHMKPNLGKRFEVPAGPPSGLYVVVHPTGRKSWALRYRWHGRPTKLTFKKSFPELGLAAARAEAEAALTSLERGIDPSAVKAEEEAREPNSVRQVAAEWLERKVRATRTAAQVERFLNKEILPSWNRKLITEIGRADALRLLDAIVDRGSPITANRTLSIMKRWLGWSVERGYIEISPVANIRPPSVEKSRERVLSEDELREVWESAGTLGYPNGPFVRLLILTAQRRGEVAGMRWQDVNLNDAMWRLSAEQTKAGRVHDVPLSGPALNILENLPRFQGESIFSTTGGLKAINGFSKLQNAVKAVISKRSGTVKLNDWTVHDLRRTAATWMAQANVPPHVLSAILNHSAGSAMGVTAIYNRFRYEKERREALQKWADYVLALAEPGRKLAAS